MTAYILLGSVYLLCASIAAIRPMHMYQLESYQNPGYFRWLKEAGEETARGYIPAAFLAMLGLFGGWVVPYTAMAPLLLSAFLCRPKKGAKKPFKLTARALRQLIILTLLQSIVAAASVFLPGRFRYVLLAAGFVGILWLVPFSGLCNLPFQKMVNKGYIRDAKKILRGMPDLTVIGVTGSYGKTSVKFYLQAVLSVKYNVFVTPESYNTPMGIVRAIREGLRPHHQIFVCEMGARHPGDIRECCDIVNPRHGIITAVGPQHLETFGTVERVAATKFELCRALPADGLCFVNWGSEAAREYPAARALFSYGIHDEAALRASEPLVGPEGSRFRVNAPDGQSYEFTTALLGRHNVENLCGAIAVAWHFGIALPEMAAAIRAIRPVPHRLELKNLGGGLMIIDDAFNANPAGTAAALEVLRLFDGLKILITPGMVELGVSESEENCSFGKHAAEVCDRIALVGEKRAEDILRGIRASGGFPEDRVKCFESFEKAFRWARSLDAGGRLKYILLANDLPDNY